MNIPPKKINLNNKQKKDTKLNDNSKSMGSQKSLVEAAEKYTKLFQDPKIVETFKELGHDVQKDLAVIEEESKKINIAVKQEKVGFFTNIIAHILKFLYAGKAKALYNKINNDPRLIESNKKLEQARANYIKTISDPSVKEAFKKYGYDIEKDFLHYSDIIKPKNEV